MSKGQRMGDISKMQQSRNPVSNVGHQGNNVETIESLKRELEKVKADLKEMEGIAQESEDEKEEIKKRLDEVEAGLDIRSSKKTRVKNKRVSFLLYEDDYREFKKNCKDKHVSANDCICQLIEKWNKKQKQ